MPHPNSALGCRHRRIAAGLVSVLAVVACLLMAGSASASVSQRFWAVQYPNLTLPAGQLTMMDDAKVGTVRIYLPWSWVDAHGWSASDGIVGALASKGIASLPVLSGSPSWAEPTEATPPLDSQTARDGWRNFLHQAVKRYGPGGDYWAAHPGVRYVPIRAWQVWREPNLKRFFPPRSSPGRYATLLRISHAAIRGVDPNAKIVLAGMPGYRVKFKGWNFLNQLYKHRGIKSQFEVVAIHAYAPNRAFLRYLFRRWRRVEKRHHD